MTPNSEPNEHIIMFSETAEAELRAIPLQHRQQTLTEIEALAEKYGANRSPPFTDWCAAIGNGYLILFLEAEDECPFYVGRVIKMTAALRRVALTAKGVHWLLQTASDLFS